MALALMTQWLFNFVIAKITPLMLSNITYGTFLFFGTFCMIMLGYAVLCVPETKNVPLESMHVLFEGSIIRGALRDTVPRWSRAKGLADRRMVERSESVNKGDVRVEHVEEA